MLQRKTRVCAALILLCLVASCATKKVSRRELCDTSVFNNTVWRSFQYRFDDTLDIIILDEDSVKPTKRVIRHSRLKVNDTTKQSEVMTRKQEEEKIKENQPITHPHTIGIKFVLGLVIVLSFIVLLVVRHVGSDGCCS